MSRMVPNVYELISGFDQENWRKFARTKLKLSEQVIIRIAEKYHDQFKEQRIQMLNEWIEAGGNEELFRRLKHEFFCGDYRPANITSIALSDGTVARPSQAVSEDEPDGVENLKPGPGSVTKITGTGLINLGAKSITVEKQPEVDDSDAYPQTGKGGCALIISNSFEGEGVCKSRKNASDQDVRMMRELWEEKLECKLFEERVHEDVTAGEMKRLFNEFAQMREEYDYVVVVVSTHGGAVPKSFLETLGPDSGKTFAELTKVEKSELANSNQALVEVLIGHDEKIVSVREIKESFSNVKAEVLRNIPKLFIFEYCRGPVVDGGVFPNVEHVKESAGPLSANANKQMLFQDILPEMSDCLIGYPTLEFYKAYNSPENGSWFLEQVADIFGKRWEEKHVVDMLTRVNAEMKVKCGRCHGRLVKAMSVFESSLTMDFHLSRPSSK